MSDTLAEALRLIAEIDAEIAEIERLHQRRIARLREEADAIRAIVAQGGTR